MIDACDKENVLVGYCQLWIMVYIDVTISELENSNPAHCHWIQSGKFVKGPFFSGHYARLLSGDQPLFTQVLRKSVTEPSPSRHPRAGVTPAQTWKLCLTIVGEYNTLRRHPFFVENAY